MRCYEKQTETQRSFSMIYLSDHGLSHEMSKDNIVIQNGKDRSKLHYDIPLFKISSDDTQRNIYKTFKSGLNFTNGIANWIGIENTLLDKELDLFNNKTDKSDYGLKKSLKPNLLWKIRQSLFHHINSTCRGKLQFALLLTRASTHNH